MPDTEKKPKQILLSASIATFIMTTLTNPLDVIKVRLIKDSMVYLLYIPKLNIIISLKDCTVGRHPHFCQSSLGSPFKSSHPYFTRTSISMKIYLLFEI